MTLSADKLRLYRCFWPRKRFFSLFQLSSFFDRHDGADLLDQRIIEVDPDREDLERMLPEYWSQRNTKR